jgi:hypothetical protein
MSYTHSMQKGLIILVAIFPLVAVLAEPIIPTAPGMSWQYNMTQEVGEGVQFSDLKPDADGKLRAVVTYRIDGIQNVDGKDLLKFEMHRAGMITNTDLVTVDQSGIRCWARIGLDGEMVKLDPPQTIIATPLKTGVSWDFDGDVAGTKSHQHYQVAAEEDVVVPAGEFHAFRVHGEQTSPTSMVMDRWFANGTGIVKDVTTMRSETGDLLRRISLDLKERPKIAARPEVKPAEAKLSVSLGPEPIGKPTAQISSRTPKIYARWQGHGLRDQAKIRVVWIAENIVKIAPPDYTIDEASTTATGPDSHGIFTLSRPDNGWALGDYRAEFYVDDALTEIARLKISK